MSWFTDRDKATKKAETDIKKYRERNPEGPLPRGLQKQQQNARAAQIEADDLKKEKGKAAKNPKTKAMKDKLDGKKKKR